MTPKRLRCLNGPDIILGPKYVKIFVPANSDTDVVITLVEDLKKEIALNFPGTSKTQFIGHHPDLQHPPYTYEYVF